MEITTEQLKIKQFFGRSTIGVCILVGANENGAIESFVLNMTRNRDGVSTFKATYVDLEDTLPAHYEHVKTFYRFMKCYDDDGLARKIFSRRIEVWRAGNGGFVFKFTNSDKIRPRHELTEAEE